MLPWWCRLPLRRRISPRRLVEFNGVPVILLTASFDYVTIVFLAETLFK